MDLTTYFAIALNQHVITKCLDDAESVLKCREKHLEHSEPMPHSAKAWLKTDLKRKAYVIDPDVAKNDLYLADPKTKKVTNRDHLGLTQRVFLSSIIKMGSPILLGQYAFGATHLLSTTTSTEALNSTNMKENDTAGTYHPNHKTAFSESEDYLHVVNTDVARHEGAHIMQHMFEHPRKIIMNSVIDELTSMGNEERLEFDNYSDHKDIYDEFGHLRIFADVGYIQALASYVLSKYSSSIEPNSSIDIVRSKDENTPEHLDFRTIAIAIEDLENTIKNKPNFQDDPLRELKEKSYEMAENFLNKFFPKTQQLTNFMSYHQNNDTILSNNPAFIAAYESDIIKLASQTDRKEVIGSNKDISYATPFSLVVSDPLIEPVTINGQLESCFSKQAIDDIPKILVVDLKDKKAIVTGGYHKNQENARYEAFAEIFADLSDSTKTSPLKVASQFPCTSKFVQAFIDSVNTQWSSNKVNVDIDYGVLKEKVQNIKEPNQILKQNLGLGK